MGVTGEAICFGERLTNQIGSVHDVAKFLSQGGQFDLMHDVSRYGLTREHFGIEGGHSIGYRSD